MDFFSAVVITTPHKTPTTNVSSLFCSFFYGGAREISRRDGIAWLVMEAYDGGSLVASLKLLSSLRAILHTLLGGITHKVLVRVFMLLVVFLNRRVAFLLIRALENINI